MRYAPAANSRYAAFPPSGGSSPLGTWLRSVLQRLVPARSGAPVPRDHSRELAEVRAYAMSVRNSDPGFASDLFAAADRHERMPN
ncbi:MAG: hypothetical protein M9915_18165 [Rhizobacter sp.]|nr:hypothetical protein [Burkholderiaceae bacterium]MCO5125648.1 hypothetical protein [Rhizobacter sp.]